MSYTQEIDLLLVEDDPDDARYVERLLSEFGSVDDRPIELGRFDRADRLDAALDRLEADPDVVLLDLELPDSEGIDTVEAVVERAPHVPVVVITGRRETGLGREAIRRGAQDYLKKGRIIDEVLHRTIRYAIDRHDTQREIVELNHRLSLLNRIVRQDVRDDVHVVVGRGDELRSRVGPDLEPVAASLLDAARHAVELTDRAGELIDVLSTDHEPTLEEVDLAGLIDERSRRIRETHDVALTVDRDGAEGDRVTVRAMPILGSALEQLLSNAVRYNDHDRPTVTVRVETAADRATVSVADDGVGIPDVQKDLLNDPETRYHERSGIGTGLYLVTTVVEQVGGTVEFADNRPEGTIVTVRLQRAE